MVGVAAAAAAATAAASIASAATSASGGKGGGGAPTMKGMAPWERIFNRGTADMNDEERRVMEDALSQANFMQPEMYKLLGYEPIYDDKSDPAAMKQLGDQADALRRQQQEGKTTIESNRVSIKETRQQLKQLKGKKNKAKRQELKQSIREMHAEIKTAKQSDGPLQKEAAAAQQQLSDMQTTPRRVIGIKKLDHPADPTSSNGDLYQMAFDLQNQALVRALKGEEPVDATLRHAWDEKEKETRERLRRQLGPDYETSTAGADALSLFDRQRNDAFSTYNTQMVAQLSQETENRATSLSNLTSARMQQLQYPANTQMAHALSLGQAAKDRLGVADLFQHERLAQYESKNNAHQQDQAADIAHAQQIASLIDSAGQGVGAAGQTASGMGKYLGTAQPDTVTVPTQQGPWSGGYGS